jgi:hypothetical protein
MVKKEEWNLFAKSVNVPIHVINLQFRCVPAKSGEESPHSKIPR